MAGAASRRKAEEMIKEGRVTINGTVVRGQGAQITPGKDAVALDGAPVRLTKANKMYYVMLHKPEGYITSTHDPEGRPVVTDLIHGFPQHVRLLPVGRLDFDTSGLLLLTNDGDFAQRLTHPRYQTEKTYVAQLRNPPNDAALRRFKTGIKIDGQVTAPARIKTVGNGRTAHISIREGRNRQIRKMCDAVGCPVLRLKRIAIGPLQLGPLVKGTFRRLTFAEVEMLRRNGEKK